MLDKSTTQLEERDGKLYFFNPQDYENGVRKLESLEKVYRRVGDLLREYGYPTKEIWQYSILHEGSPALERLVAEDSDENARRLRVQRYLLETWREVALSKIPEKLKTEVDKLPREINRLSDGLPILKKDLSFRERTFFLDVESVKTRLRAALTIAVPEKIIQESQKMRDVILSVRELEEGGLNAKELVRSLVGEYLAPDLYPELDEKSLLLSVFLRRHQTREQVLLTNPEYVSQIEAVTRESMKNGLYGLSTTLPVKS